MSVDGSTISFRESINGNFPKQEDTNIDPKILL